MVPGNACTPSEHRRTTNPVVSQVSHMLCWSLRPHRHQQVANKFFVCVFGPLQHFGRMKRGRVMWKKFNHTLNGWFIVWNKLCCLRLRRSLRAVFGTSGCNVKLLMAILITTSSRSLIFEACNCYHVLGDKWHQRGRAPQSAALVVVHVLEVACILELAPGGCLLLAAFGGGGVGRRWRRWWLALWWCF